MYRYAYHYVFDEENIMDSFYIFAFVFGILLLCYFAVLKQRINKFNNFICFNDDAPSDINGNISVAQKMLERTDKVLFYLRSFEQNIALKLLCAVGVFMLIYFANQIFSWQLKQNTILVLGILLLLAFVILPGYVIKFVIEQRIKKIGDDIPMFVDLLAVCVQSGMPIEASLKFLQGSISEINKAFAPFLNKLVSKIEVSGLESALVDLQNELPSKEISMMCSTLQQSIKYGSGIYESLMSLSSEIRESSLLATEEAIGKLSAKMSVPLILFFMFPVIIVIAAPGVMRILGGFL